MEQRGGRRSRGKLGEQGGAKRRNEKQWETRGSKGEQGEAGRRKVNQGEARGIQESKPEQGGGRGS
jgi:hypothetical protein